MNASEKLKAQILPHLYEDSGLTTGCIAGLVTSPFKYCKRSHSAYVRGRLLELEAEGKVRRLDDLKPVCWCAVGAPSKDGLEA